MDKISVGMQPTTRGFLSLIAENGRLPELIKICGTFDKLMDAQRGIVSATVTSAEEYTPQRYDEIEKVIKTTYLKPGQSLRLDAEVDPSLLGGFQIRVGDVFMDFSVASEIGKIEKILRANVE